MSCKGNVQHSTKKLINIKSSTRGLGWLLEVWRVLVLRSSSAFVTRPCQALNNPKLSCIPESGGACQLLQAVSHPVHPHTSLLCLWDIGASMFGLHLLVNWVFSAGILHFKCILWSYKSAEELMSGPSTP